MTWDAIIIGTGIGGGTTGRALAEAGLRVLFLEQGPSGYRAEETRLDDALVDPVARAIRGFWPDPVTVRLDGRETTLFAPLGAGVGGSSVFYAATLERPAPHDIDHSADRPHPTGGWPVSHADLLPWLQRAEALYHVTGQPDPLDPGPPLPPGPAPDAGDTSLMARLAARGLHPYRLHSAIATPARLRRLPWPQMPARLQDGWPVRRGGTGAGHRARHADGPHPRAADPD